MPLVNAICTNCGRSLQVDNTKDAAICNYCGSAYIVEKAINNYNAVNNVHVNVVNIYGGNSADFVIRGGVLEKYNGASTHVIIPNSVRCIAKEAFMNTYIESVLIPDSVKHIEEKTFYCCVELKKVHIPDSVVVLGRDAFFGCSSLTHVVLSNNLKVLNQGTFQQCINLVSINIPRGISFDGIPFYNNGKLIDVIFEDEETAERLWTSFPHSPIFAKKKDEQDTQRAKEKEKQQQSWRRAGVCDLCGGTFKGLISKKCTSCGKEKRY